MSRFIPLNPTLTELAEDAVDHLTGFAQTVLDVVSVATLGLAFYLATPDHSQPVQTPVVAIQVASNCAAALLSDSCITQRVLLPQGS